MSTSQLVGYVSITAEDNPKIVDTSDRERLSSCTEVAEFEEILKAIVKMLEIERAEDRVTPHREDPMTDLFTKISADELITNVTDLAQEGAPASEAIPLIRSFGESLDETRKSIQERFVYYSRLATVGTIAQMIIHEIRNRTTTFGAVLRSFKRSYGPFQEQRTIDVVRRAEESVDALERLADTFAPLANRRFTRRKHSMVLEDRIRACLEMNEADIRGKNIQCLVPQSRTLVAADPGELDTILLNLIVNSSHWLGEVPEDNRVIEFELELKETDNGPRVNVSIHDNGPGIDSEDIEKVFLPGITRKPDGIGMGLNVASELAAVYGSEMRTIRKPTKRGGASFTFDLPYEGKPEGGEC